MIDVSQQFLSDHKSTPNSYYDNVIIQYEMQIDAMKCIIQVKSNYHTATHTLRLKKLFILLFYLLTHHINVLLSYQLIFLIK